jgi:ankyrin repeat protein
VFAVLAAISAVVVFGVLRGETHPWVSAATDALVAMAAAVERATATAMPQPAAAVARAGDYAAGGGAPPASAHAPTPLMRAARMGSVVGVERALAATPKPSVNELFGDSQQTAVNIALAGWHGAVGEGAAKRYDGYGRTVELLIENGADLALMCPLVDAVHYRNQRAFDLIVAASSAATLRACLSEADAFGDTVLHLVAKSPAAGIARLFASKRIALESPLDVLERAKSAAAEKGEGAAAAAAAPGAARGRDVDRSEPTLALLKLRRPWAASYTALSAAAAPWFAHEVIALAKRVGLLDEQNKSSLLDDASAWREARNGMGLTPLLVACESGMEEVLGALLRAGANGDARDTWGRSCAHLAAGPGDHLDTLHIWAHWRAVATQKERGAECDVLGTSLRSFALARWMALGDRALECKRVLVVACVQSSLPAERVMVFSPLCHWFLTLPPCLPSLPHSLPPSRPRRRRRVDSVPGRDASGQRDRCGAIAPVGCELCSGRRSFDDGRHRLGGSPGCEQRNVDG